MSEPQTPIELGAVLRKALRQTGLSILKLSEQTGIRYSALHAFINDETRDARLSTVNALCNFLGLELRPRPRRKPRGVKGE